MGPVLAIDTSTAMASVAVYNGGVLAETTWRSGRHHSRDLLRVIDDCLRLAEVDRSDLRLIALASGPGSYAGLRVGASTALGLALGLELPVVQVPTLEVVAYAAGWAGEVRAAVELGRGRYATARFFVADRTLEPRGPLESLTAAEVRQRAADEGSLLVGDVGLADGAAEAAGPGERRLCPAARSRRASFLAELAEQRAPADGEEGVVGQLIYVSS